MILQDMCQRIPSTTQIKRWAICRLKKFPYLCSMIGILLTLLTYGILMRDVIVLRRERRTAANPARILRLWLFILIDLLPVALLACYLIDNTPTVVRISMWITWSWILITAPRVCYGLFALLRLRCIGLGVAALAALAMIYGATLGRQSLRTEEVTISSCRLPASFDGYRIALFSDLHLGSLVNTEKEVTAVVEEINHLDADIVLFAGDLVNIRHTELDERASKLLKQIRRPVLSVIGNHDVGTYIIDTLALPASESYAQLLERIEAMGWQSLQDTTLYLTREQDSISLSGFAYNPAFKKERHDYDLPMSGADKGYQGVPTELYNITLVHVPQHWEEIISRGYGDLTLSGHTHAMQCKLRVGKGRGLSPARLIYKQWSGLYEQDNHALYINDGIGYVAYPMRIGARPEITLITLRRCE